MLSKTLNTVAHFPVKFQFFAKYRFYGLAFSQYQTTMPPFTNIWCPKCYIWCMIAGLAVLTNGVVLLVQTSLMKSPHDEDDASKIYVPWVSYFFVACKFIIKSKRKFRSPCIWLTLIGNGKSCLKMSSKQYFLKKSSWLRNCFCLMTPKKCID